MSKFRFLATATCCLLLAGPPTDAKTRDSEYYQRLRDGLSVRTLCDEGRYAEALVPASSMLQAATAQGDTASVIDSHQALARLLVRVGRADSARGHAAAALHLSHSVAGRSMCGSSLWVMAEVVEAQGREDSSLVLLQAAAGAAMATADSLVAGLSLGVLGDRLLAGGRSDAALARLDSAVTLLVPSGDPGQLSQVHATRARCQHRLGMYAPACREFEVAYRLLTEARTHAFTDPARLYLMDRARLDFFAEWQDSWLSRGTSISFQYRALGVAERARAQALLDLVQPADTMVTDSSGLLHRVMSPGRRFGPGRDLAEDTRAAIVGAVPPDAALLYYSQLPDSLVIWISRRGVLFTVKTYYPARLFERIQPFLAATSDTNMAPEGTNGWWFRHMAATGGAENMYTQVAKACFPDTLLTLLKDASELIIIPDGWLKQVPFAAMPVAGKPLGLRLPLRYAPSLAMLEHIERRSRPERPPQLEEVMVLGDPASCLPRLAGARAEAESVAAVFGIKPLLGRAATESTVTAEWQRLRVLHLAAHGDAYADPRLALESMVCLTPTSDFDGRLTAGEVQNVLPASHLQLVFLSACKTAFGASSRADATVGLPRALLANGARTVVASMWRLDDGSTEWLVHRFYHHLVRDHDHPSVARALHLAMIDTSLRPGWSDPFFWAGLQVVGGY